MIHKVKETISKFSLIEKGDRVLVAVSGGVDSVALLFALYEIGRELDFTLGIAHFHHGLRATADRDQEFVKKLAEGLNIPFHTEKKNVYDVAKDRGWGIEEAARVARYEFLENIKKKFGYNKVALGHNLNDNVETFLLRVIRGGSLEGLKGIPPKRDFWIRPLIEIKRDEIIDFVNKRNLEFVVDETNFEEDILRNWIRLRLIPLLSEKNPSIVDTIATTLNVLREEHEFIEEAVTEVLKKIPYRFENKVLVIPLKSMDGVPRIIRRKIIFKLLYKFFYTGLPNAVGYKHVEAILNMAEKREGTKFFSLPKGVVVSREYDSLIIYEKPGWENRHRQQEVVITGPGIYPFNGYLFEVIEGDFSTVVIDGKWNALFDANKLKYPLLLRYKRPGDRILIKGVGRKKLQDFFVDKKIPRRERESIPILVDKEGNVCWIVGYRQREDLKPEGKGKSILIRLIRRDL